MAQEPQANSQTSSQTASASGPVLLRDRFSIDPSKPLGGLDMPNAHAYHCDDKRNSTRPMFALVVDGPLPPRIGLMRALRGVTGQGIMPLVEWGVVDWPPVEGRCIAVVYERPLGGRVMRSMDAVIQPIPDQQINKVLLKPLVSALTELQAHSIVHRAIRPDNLYWMDKEKTQIVIGDGATSPAGYFQPMICETIESGMAMPAGRGAGYFPHDMYALGATLVVVSVGHNPLSQLSEADVLKEKIASGSYATVVGEERVPLQLIEPVRGLLGDDVEQRWSLDTIEMWSAGRRMPTMQSHQEKRSARPFVFQKVEYYSRRALAHALAADWEAGAVPIMEGKVEIWVRRGLEMGDLSDSIGNVVRASNVGAKDAGVARDMAITSVLTLLDPHAPVRYRDCRFHLEAAGTVMACQLAVKGDIRPVVELVQREFTKTWMAAQESFARDMVHLDTEFRDLKTYLQQTSKGGGVERCLYEMNESLTCRSPMLRDQCVLEIKDLLPALERVSGKVDTKQWPTDRHVVAFIAARYAKDTMAQIHALNDPDPRTAALGMLSLLAVLQWKLGPESLPGLGSWLGGLMTPAINSFHSRERRKKLEKEVPKVVRRGSLPEMYHMLDDNAERQDDFDGFMVARQQYAQAAQQMAALESGNYRVSESSEKLGQQTASSISVAIALLSIIFVTLIHLT